MEGEYLVSYTGNSKRLKDLAHKVWATSERDAVEQTFSLFCEQDYFPHPNGQIFDCEGNVICEAGWDYIRYDGGIFKAERVWKH